MYIFIVSIRAMRLYHIKIKIELLQKITFNFLSYYLTIHFII